MKNETKNIEKRNILVVEDNADYLAQVRGIFARRDQSRLHLDVGYASTLEESLTEISNGRYDGVMSDLFFPDSAGGQEVMNGTNVAQACLDGGLPVVIVTSQYHHDRNVEPANKWVRERGFNLVDTCTDWGGSPGKNFLGALITLGNLLEFRDRIEITSEGFGPREYGACRLYSNLTTFANNMDSHRRNGRMERGLETAEKRLPGFNDVVQKYCGGLSLLES